jgi:hypothetical protein
MVGDQHQFTYILDEFGREKTCPRIDFMNLFYPISEWSIPGIFFGI